jgi:hypothetical protein
VSQEKKIECVNRFIALANEMTAEGDAPGPVVSSGLMMACAVYSTYVVTGNDGALRESGVEKLTKLFGEELATVQARKIEQAERDGKNVSTARENGESPIS